MRADYINPVLVASSKIIKMLFQQDITLGELSLMKRYDLTHCMAVIIWMKGDFEGRFIFVIDRKTACHIASIMIGEKVDRLDNMAKSALGELANMIMGRTGIVYSERGINVITSYPSLIEGDSIYISPLKQTDRKIIVNIPMKMTDGDVINLRIEKQED